VSEPIVTTAKYGGSSESAVPMRPSGPDTKPEAGLILVGASEFTSVRDDRN
jgi:hypothetical protein